MAKKEVPKIRIVTLNQESWGAPKRGCPSVNFRCGCECVHHVPCQECLVQCEIPCQCDSEPQCRCDSKPSCDCHPHQCACDSDSSSSNLGSNEGMRRTFFKLAGDEDSK